MVWLSCDTWPPGQSVLGSSQYSPGQRARSEAELSQFGRALKTLDIEAFHARTPWAQERVERANQTLLGRLAKEMRLAGIDSIEAANTRLRYSQVTVCEAFGGTTTLAPSGPGLDYTCCIRGEAPPLADDKAFNAVVDHAKDKQRRRQPWKPAPDHPWRRSTPLSNIEHTKKAVP